MIGMMVAVGTVIGGRFRVDAILGSGGMGVVVAATHVELGHRVAIKLLRDHMQTPAIVERFLREARSVVNLKTDNVCRVTDVGRMDDGAPYIVMEMLQGSDLEHAVAAKPLPITTAVEYVMQACIAVAEAHHAGIIHRDLKPANLFITRRFDGGPLVKVLDFGIAKALDETSMHQTQQSPMGSPPYMSPEQIFSARDVDLRTDIWALGVTLYQLLSSRLPFPAPSFAEIAIRVSTGAPEPLDVDPALCAVIWRCLEKDRERRYDSVAELAAALVPFGGPSSWSHLAAIGQIGVGEAQIVANASGALGFAATAGTLAPAPAISAPFEPEPFAPPRRRRWPWVAVALGVVTIVGIALAGALGGAKQEQVARAPADAAVVPQDAAQIAAIAPDAGAAVSRDAGVHSSPAHRTAPPPVKTTPTAAQPAPAPAPAESHGFGIGALAKGTLSAVKDTALRGTCSVAGKAGAAMGAVKPAMVTCACSKKDQATAEKLYGRLTDERSSVRSQCAQLGITLPP